MAEEENVMACVLDVAYMLLCFSVSLWWCVSLIMLPCFCFSFSFSSFFSSLFPLFSFLLTHFFSSYSFLLSFLCLCLCLPLPPSVSLSLSPLAISHLRDGYYGMPAGESINGLIVERGRREGIVGCIGWNCTGWDEMG